jgi:23S rRNA (guanosine2251-2'-O)-methyltransferase
MKRHKDNRHRQGKRAERDEHARQSRDKRAGESRNEHARLPRDGSARETPGERVSRAFASERSRASKPESSERVRASNTERNRHTSFTERNRQSSFEDNHHITSARRRASGAEHERLSRVSVDDAHTDAFESNTDAHVFGVQPVLEALRAGARPVERVTIAEGAHEARLHEIFELARSAGVPIRRAPRAELQRLASWANHQGVVATIAAARYADAEMLLDALAARVGTQEPPLAVVLDGVEDPRNLGAIIRTVECAGAHGVFVPERRAAGLTETVAKAAAGALEYVPVARAANIARLLEKLKERGVWTVGTAADAETAYTDWDWTQPCALILGGEGVGLRRLVRERCDVLVSILVRGHIESLNVSVAAGIILYEALRQRTARRSQTYNERGTTNAKD